VNEGKPVLITFPSYDIGAADIKVGGKHAGIILGEFDRWRAYLYPVLTSSRIWLEKDCEEVTAGSLTELRRVLRERVELKGPWWQ
jgi:hypothetical protein